MDSLIFLGTGDSMGVPRVYCGCGVCAEARSTGVNRRLRSSVLIATEAGELVVDCGPDWKLQMENMRRRETEHVLITHAHHDHIGGLPEWADACRWLRKKGHLYAPAEVLEKIRQRFPWLENHLVYHPNDEGMQFGGWRIMPWKVCHGKNGYAYAYHFSKAGFRWAYCSDAINLTEEQKEPLRGLDLLVIGTNFYKEEAEMRSRSVYDMTEAAELAEEVQAGRVVFTHMSHGVDMEKPYPLPPQIGLARTGMRIGLP